MNALAAAVQRFRGNPLRNEVGPIGIDFALEEIHLVQLEFRSNGQPQVRARASLPFENSRREALSQPLQFRSIIKRALASANFYGRKCVIAVPSDRFRTVSINYKSGAGKEQEAAAVLNVMKDRVDGDLNNYVLDYLPVSGRVKSDERLALVAVSERAAIMSLLENARKSRLDVGALEIGPVAVSRLVSAYAASDGIDNVMVINSGRRASYLTLLCGSDLLFDQEVSFGEINLIRQVAETLDMPEDMTRGLILRTGVRSSKVADPIAAAVDEAGVVNALSEILKPHFLKLVQEIKRVCQYAAAETRGGAVGKVYLLGSVARWPGSDGLISSLTGVDVMNMPNPLMMFVPAGNEPATDGDNSAPELSVATGLALRGMNANG
ncbi:MAG: pilus assembly protein PilM [Woeseia sp.]|nr:pilus assembly protein PilM [Woeseia sp.]NNE59561.1 pilus assembly protein PilM [Woeseia sp.]